MSKRERDDVYLALGGDHDRIMASAGATLDHRINIHRPSQAAHSAP